MRLAFRGFAANVTPAAGTPSPPFPLPPFPPSRAEPVSKRSVDLSSFPWAVLKISLTPSFRNKFRRGVRPVFRENQDNCLKSLSYDSRNITFKVEMFSVAEPFEIIVALPQLFQLTLSTRKRFLKSLFSVLETPLRVTWSFPSYIYHF